MRTPATVPSSKSCSDSASKKGKYQKGLVTSSVGEAVGWVADAVTVAPTVGVAAAGTTVSPVQPVRTIGASTTVNAPTANDRNLSRGHFILHPDDRHLPIVPRGCDLYAHLVMARWLAATALAAALSWYDPASLRWLGVALLATGALVLLWRAARWDRHRRLRRTLNGLRALPPAEFEAEVGRWLRRDGWRIEHRGGTGDGGIDIVATKRRETLAIQCKRYAETTPVTASQVRDLYGAAVATGATGAVLVTTGRVSRAAREWCEALPAGPPIRLVEADHLAWVALRRAHLP